MKTKHTPGPWNAYKYPDTKTWTVAAKASVASKIKDEADAKLIAAAPEMLEALETARKYVLGDIGPGREDEVLEYFDAVLAKARGES